MRAWLLAALLVSLAARELPAEPQTAPAASRARVRVRLVGALSREATLRDRIQSWFDAGRYEVTLEGASYVDPNQVLSPDSGLLVDAWVTQRSQRSVRLYFVSVDAEARKPRYLLRDLQLDAGLDEVGAEELAQAVHLSASALVEGQMASPREQVEESLREASSPVASSQEKAVKSRIAVTPRDASAARASQARRPLELQGGFGYAVALRGDEGVAHGPRARLELLDGVTGCSALARVNVVVPHSVSRAELDLKLYGGAALLALGCGGALSSNVQLRGFVGPSLELVRYSASPQPGKPFVAAAAATELRPALAGGVVVAFGRAPRLALVPELSIAWKDTHYDLNRGGGLETVARASRVTALLGLELEL